MHSSAINKTKRTRPSNEIDRTTKNHNSKYKNLVLDIDKRTVKRGEKTLELRNKEFCMLELLMEKKGRTVTKRELTEILWDSQTTLLSNTLESHMSKLRKKIDREFNRKLIHTVPFVGYRLE